MSKIWPHFSKENPCPACGGSDWCCRGGDKVFVCMRVESSRPHRDGGFFHEYGGKKAIQVLQKRFVPPKVNLDFGAMHKGAMSVTKNDFWPIHAEVLGVDWTALFNLQAVKWHDEIGIPMRDGDNKIIGIHLRADDGSKKAVTGSRNGLFIPSSVGELIERNKLKT